MLYGFKKTDDEMRHIDKKQLPVHEEVVVDVAIVGAGAAGLFAAIWAGKKGGGHSIQIAVLDSARKLGAKILVAGGGRCNVTHCQVTEHDFAGSSPAAIRKVLRRFSVKQTVQFFADAGVELKQEETGKLFPVSDSARTILQALLDQAQSVDAFIRHPARVTDIDQLPCNGLAKGRNKEPRLRVVSEEGVLLARNVIVCTGGKSLPKSGSDGSGYRLVEKLGHTITKPLVPALVPLTLVDGHWIRGLSGVTVPAAVTLSKASGKRMCTYSGSTLCTHLGLSGPSILDISRHWLIEQHADSDVRLHINWLPEHNEKILDDLLQEQRMGAFGVLRRWLPDRLARQLCLESGARTHQIRVHLAAIGCPVLADALYSGRSSIDSKFFGGPQSPPVILCRQALHAATLILDHPTTGERLTFSSPLPPDIQNMLDVLRKHAALS